MHSMTFPLAGALNQQLFLITGKILVGASSAVTSHTLPGCTVHKEGTGLFHVVFNEKMVSEPLVFVTVETDAGIDLITQTAYMGTDGFFIVTLTHATPSDPDTGTYLNVMIVGKKTAELP